MPDVQRTADEQPAADEQAKSEDEKDSSGWIGLVAVLLLSVTAILTAWTGFQASKWGGAMSISFTQAGTARVESAVLAGEADRFWALQVQIYAQWLEATLRGDKETADALSSRFKEPLKTAHPAWLATDPFNNPDAPENPFDMPEYRSEVAEESKQASDRADALFAEGLENNQQGDNYTILTVLGAVVLFFTAMSSRVKKGRNQWILLGSALVLFGVIVVLLASYPRLV
jgi:hypothetical protein